MSWIGAGLVVAVVAGVVVVVMVSQPHSAPASILSPSSAIGSGWEHYDLMVSPGDWDAIGTKYVASDIIARKVGDGSLWLFSGDGTGRFTGPAQIGSGWNIYTQLVAAGSFRGHDHPNDLMAVRSDGHLMLFPNPRNGVLGTPVSLGSGWGAYDAVIGSRDFNGDQKPDVIVRNAADGSLWLYKGDGQGSFSGHSLITSVSFAKYSLLAVPGDWNNEGYPDLVARSPDGTLCLFRGDGRGGLQNTDCIPIGRGWGAFDAIVAPGTWDRDNQVDLLARTRDGKLWLATGGGIAGYSDPLSLPQCSTIALHISSVSPAYTVSFQKFGRANPQSVATLSADNGQVQGIPPDASRAGADWQTSATFSNTCGWSSGLYAAELATTGTVGATGATLSYKAYVSFVVSPRAPPPARQLLVVASTNTWNAYNDWPQRGSFYNGPPHRRPRQVSYLRPDPGASPLSAGSHLAGGELQVLQWLEAHRFAYQMVTDVDLNDNPSIMSTANYYAVLINTHSEYWTDPMYNGLSKYLQDGGSVLNLSGNTMYREVKLLKARPGDAWSSQLAGGTESARPPYAVGAVTGLQFYETGDTCAPYHVLQPRAWLMAGVKANTIGARGKYWERGCFLNSPGAGAGASGDEFDRRLPFLLNRRYEVVAAGTNAGGGADLVWFLRRGGGQVVSVGSISFGNSLAIDAHLSRIVINALADFRLFKDRGQTSFGGLVAPGDWDGDGHPDLFARRGDRLYLVSGNGAGGWWGSRLIGGGWAQYNLLAPAGSWSGHDRPDLFARRASDGALFVLPNDWRGGFKTRFRIGARVNWSKYDTIAGVGDWNGSKFPSLIARTPSGLMYLYTGSGDGQVNPTPKLLATGWDAYDQIVTPVDWNGDGLPDLVARKPDGSMWIALGRRDHTLATPVEMQYSGGLDGYSTIIGGGDWTNKNHQDLVARKADGSLWLARGIGATSFGRTTSMGIGWNQFS